MLYSSDGDIGDGDNSDWVHTPVTVNDNSDGNGKIRIVVMEIVVIFW